MVFSSLRNSLGDQTSGSRCTNKSMKTSSILSRQVVSGLGNLSAKKNLPDGSVDVNTSCDDYGVRKAHETVIPFCKDCGSKIVFIPNVKENDDESSSSR